MAPSAIIVVMVVEYILILHVILGLLTVTVAALPLVGVRKLDSLFLPGYFSVAVSGIGLVVMQQTGITVACVRFLVLMTTVLALKLYVTAHVERS